LLRVIFFHHFFDHYDSEESTESWLHDEQIARKILLCGHDQKMIFEGGLTSWKAKKYPITP
jgi:hypothetical protein